MRKRRNAGFGAVKLGSLEAVLRLQLHEAVEHAMGCASARKRLVRHLRNAPDLADIARYTLQIAFCLDHTEISERSLQDVLDAGNAAARQIGCDHGIARVETDL